MWCWLFPLLQRLEVGLPSGAPAVIGSVVTVTVSTLHVPLVLLGLVVLSQGCFLGQRACSREVGCAALDTLRRQSAVPGTVSKTLASVTLGSIGRPLAEVSPAHHESFQRFNFAQVLDLNGTAFEVQQPENLVSDLGYLMREHFSFSRINIFFREN